MTGWTGTGTDARVGETKAVWTEAPSAATLSEIAQAGQRQQLTALIDAVRVNPDLAAQLYAALRQSP